VSKTCVTVAGLYCGVGMVVPIAPTIAGVGAVILVRVLLWSKKQNVTWNLAVMILGILATFVSLEGAENSTFFGFWIGVSYGGIGQGIITMGRSAVLSSFKKRFGDALEVFMGTKSKSEESE
jgi:hypothetical protein